jgi:hypothetical protein
MLRQMGALTKHRFADNVCRRILALVASRLELTGFALDKNDDTLTTFINDFFTKNQLADKQYDVHFATARDGNHALGLNWRPSQRPGEDGTATGRVTVHKERWWDGETGMWIAYGDDGLPLYAVKDFTQVMFDPPRKVKRRTIYFDDHLEKYISTGALWEPFAEDTEDNGKPTNAPRWEKRDGSPLGIPVVHFANGSDDDTPYGASHLDGGVIGLQDHINDIHLDITVAARLLGFPMIFVAGYEEALTSAGQVIPFHVGPGTVAKSANPNTKITVVQPGDLTQLQGAYDMKKRAVASNTQTPEHIISGGQWPSGLALIRAEMPLIDLVKRMAKTVGPSWEQAVHRATEMYNAFAKPSLDETNLVTAEFTDPERLDEQAQAEADKLRLEVWQMLGTIEDEAILEATGLLTAEQIRKLTAEREARTQKEMEALVGAAPGEEQEGFE